MASTHIRNIVQIINNEIVLLNGLLEHYGVEMYDVPRDVTADHVTRVRADLKWVQDYVKYTSDGDVNLHRQFETVDKRLEQLHDDLRDEQTDATTNRRES